MIATTVEVLKSSLATEAPEHAISYDANAVAKDVGFLHGVSSQHNRTILVLFAVLQNIPQLTSSLWIQACGRFIKEDNLWV